MAQQLSFDFTHSAGQRARKAEKQRDNNQLTLFASWAPNIDITLHSPTEAVAHISGKEPERGADWLTGIVGGTRAIKNRRHAFPIEKLDKLAWVRPPAKVTLDASAQVIANALHAHALGFKPLKIHKVKRRVAASSPRGWPAGLRVRDAPWNAVEALLNTDLPLTIEEDAEEAVSKRLEKAGTEVAKATLSGNSILLTSSRPMLLEARELPALSYVGESGDGTYRMPLLLGDALLKDKTIKVDPKAEAVIKRATKKATPLVIEDEKWPYQLFGFQQDDAGAGIRALKATGGTLLAGGMGTGKMLRDSCEVATPAGMKPIGELVQGEHVLAPDGTPTRIRGVYPHKGWDLYKITFSDGTYALAGEEHRWWIQTPKQKHRGHPGKFMTTGEMLEAGLKQKSGNRKFYIPMTEPLQFTKRDLPIPPYTLGALLGDGSLSRERSLGFTDSDGDVVEAMRHDLLKFGEPEFEEIVFTAVAPKLKDWRITNAGLLRARLTNLGLTGSRAWEKFVPEDYLYSDVEDRLALLQGLLDTDGGCSGHGAYGNKKANYGHIEFSSTAEPLADAVVWLTQSLGGTATKSGPRNTTYTKTDGTKGRGRDSWRVRVSLPAGINPFRIDVKATKYTPREKYQPTRGIESIEYWGKDDATCIEVEHESLQFVIEHGIVTGNTMVSLGIVHELDLWPALFIGPVTAATTWKKHVADLGRSLYMATSTPKKDWEAIENGDYDAYFITFDRLEAFTELLATKNLQVIVADELQKAKNAGSRRSRALRALASAAPYRIGLSGTPLVGGLSDLLAQFSFLVPTEFPPRASKKSLEDRYPGDAIESLTDHIHSITVRRRMDQVGRKMAKREDHKVYVNLTPEQMRAIKAVEEEAQRAKEDGELDGEDGQMNALVLLGKIRGIIANPKNAGVPGPNPKLTAALKLVKEATKTDERPVVFMQDRPSYQEFTEMLTKEGIRWAGINGSTSIDERVEIERQLQSGELDCVPATMAGAESWSASPASKMCILVTPTYSAAVNEQAESRVHRMNSKVEDTVRIIYIHAKDPSGEPTNDDRLYEILEMKKALFAKVIDRIEYADNTDVSNSMSDLMYVLTGEKDEKLKKLEADQRRAGDVKRKQREHAKATIYRNKGKNKTDPNVVHDDGSETHAKE